MSINDRVKQVRSELGQTQIEFGSRTGISQGHLTSIESGKRAVTEKTLKVICATFDVSEVWLRSGKGEMFVQNDNVILSQLSKQYDLDAFSQKFIETFLSLPQAHRDVIKGFALSLAMEQVDQLGLGQHVGEVGQEVVAEGEPVDEAPAEESDHERTTRIVSAALNKHFGLNNDHEEEKNHG